MDQLKEIYDHSRAEMSENRLLTGVVHYDAEASDQVWLANLASRVIVLVIVLCVVFRKRALRLLNRLTQ